MVLEGFERTFAHADGRFVRLVVGIPKKTDEAHGDWRCDYKIEGLGDSKVRTAMGIDAIQSITLALTYISTTLYFSDDYARGQLTWEGGMSPSDLGLPVAETVNADVQLRRNKVDSMHGDQKGLGLR